ncbi:hypothetical protein ACJMK2_015848 [Sinanodonta woodiana]|uniref:Uncharacterized protein n=1 Tax=Sinanodonta woodiana TaxID=1069815 RepID=A0ABD3UUJ6_SINWO
MPGGQHAWRHHAWRTACLEVSMPGGQHAWRTSCLEVSMPGGQHAWRSACLEDSMPGGQHAWRSACLEDSMPGGQHAWRTACLEDSMPYANTLNLCRTDIMVFSSSVELYRFRCVIKIGSEHLLTHAGLQIGKLENYCTLD